MPNGKEFSSDNWFNIALQSWSMKPYYQYEKITDQKVIDRYKEIKAKDGNFLELQNMIKTTPPTSGWSNWEFWMSGYGYPVSSVSVPDNGLYYMWIFASGNNIKNIYGCVLVDNLQPTIALESISLPKTEKVAMGKTITLTPTFNPAGASNKIVTWTSSDETVATVDNAGKITPKKLGSTVITVVSQDGNKKATCTVTVVEPSNDPSGNGGTTNKGSIDGKKYDSTVATGKLPQAGVGIGLAITAIFVLSVGLFAFFKYKNLKQV